VVERSRRMPWYTGPPLLERLETMPVEPPKVHGARLPVQLVLRGEGGARWAAGRLAAGSLKPGDEVVLLPSGVRTRVAEVRDADGPVEALEAPLSGSVRLEDEVDLARGELIAAAEDAPLPTRELAATVCWLGDRPAHPGARYVLKHGTRAVPARLDAVDGRIEFETLAWPAAEELRLNDIAHVRLRLGGEIAPDAYSRCHATGAFILIDEATNDTVAAGMVAA
jgi:sulfate adenylyltransferase subunit 1 (EFTu-like GTPase family)